MPIGPPRSYYDEESGEYDVEGRADDIRQRDIDERIGEDIGERREDHPNRKVHRERFE